MFRTVYRVLVLILAMTIASPIATTSARQNADESPSSAALVSGAYRIHVHQTTVAQDPVSVGLDNTTGNAIVVAIADVTNLGVATVFDPAVVTMGSVNASPLELETGTSADAVATGTASTHLKLSLDGNFAVAENSTIRVALVFMLPADVSSDSLAMRVGEQVMSLDSTITETLDIASLPALQPTMTLRVADITAVPGSSKVSITFRDGGAEDIALAAIDTPKASATGRASVPGCFFNETSSAIMAMSGGTVWLESDPAGEGYLVWINNAAMGTFDLLNGRLVQEGYAGVSESSESPYKSWLTAATDWAKDQELGLWTTCKSAQGAWISEPTPAPVPTKTPDEIRADYTWIDSRDLVIRPGTFEGKKIVVTGSVFNIQVEGNLTAMQIWLDGGSEAAVIIYSGDTTGIYQGTWVTVYGTGAGTFEGTNGFGAAIVQPLIRADIVDW